MTTIAWDGKELAADSQSTSSGSLVSYTVKIFQGENYIMAFSGSVDNGYAFKSILEGEMKNKDASMSKDFSAIVWWNTGVVEEYYDTLIPVPVYDRFTAMGSGAAMAIAAMNCGKSAREAVELCKKLDAFTGGKVISYSWDKITKKGKKKKNESVTASDIQVPVCEVSGAGESEGRMGGDSKEVHRLPSEASNKKR